MKFFLNLILVLSCLYGVLWLFPEPEPMEDISFYSDRGFSVIAHRGGRGLVPGNTIEAAINAVNIGSDIIEIDVHLTADDILVVRHDASIDTTTNGSGQISAMSLSEIQGYDAGFHEIDYPNAKYQQLIEVPTLAALFSKLPDQRYLIELKPQDVSAADSLCGLIRHHKIHNQVMVGSFHTPMLKHFRRVCPEIPTSLGKSEITQLVLLERLNLSHLFISKGYSIQIPMTAGGVDILRPRLVNVMHKRNIRVDAWTLNDVDSMKYAIDIGVDGVITDWPDVLIELLQNSDK
jgi:glycerophosphoryl diester phosphodiesterase